MSIHNHPIYCQMTGVQIASFTLVNSIASSCASMGWQAEWKQLVCEHPMFSLTPNSCLRTARIKFRELVALPIGYSPTDPTVIAARVAFVAVLRNMGSIIRREPNSNPLPILPQPATVIAHGQLLLELAYWYANAQSVKFQFPKLNIARVNANSELMDIGAYLSVCKQNRDKWLEVEKARIARNILEDNTDEHFLNVAAKTEAAVVGGSNKRLPRTSLWNWLMAAVSSEDADFYARFNGDDNEGKFFNSLFFSSDAALKRFSIDDVDALEDILLRFAPLGTTPFYAFRTELDRMKSVIQKTTKSFTVDWTTLTVGRSGVKPAVTGVTPEGALIASEADKQAEQLALMPEPQRADYPDAVQHVRARAQWILAKHRAAALVKQAERNQIF